MKWNNSRNLELYFWNFNKMIFIAFIVFSYEMHTFFNHINSPTWLTFGHDHMSMICQQSNQILSSLEIKIFDTGEYNMNDNKRE